MAKKPAAAASAAGDAEAEERRPPHFCVPRLFTPFLLLQRLRSPWPGLDRRRSSRPGSTASSRTFLRRAQVEKKAAGRWHGSGAVIPGEVELHHQAPPPLTLARPPVRRKSMAAKPSVLFCRPATMEDCHVRPPTQVRGRQQRFWSGSELLRPPYPPISTVYGGRPAPPPTNAETPEHVDWKSYLGRCRGSFLLYSGRGRHRSKTAKRKGCMTRVPMVYCLTYGAFCSTGNPIVYFIPQDECPTTIFTMQSICCKSANWRWHLSAGCCMCWVFVSSNISFKSICPANIVH